MKLIEVLVLKKPKILDNEQRIHIYGLNFKCNYLRSYVPGYINSRMRFHKLPTFLWFCDETKIHIKKEHK